MSALSNEEKAERELRIQAEHEAQLKSMNTSTYLPRIQSCLAGAGGKTNERLRINLQHEEERQRKLKAQAEQRETQKALKEKIETKTAALADEKERKRVKRLKKLAAKKERREGVKKGSANNGSDSDSVEEKESSDCGSCHAGE